MKRLIFSFTLAAGVIAVLAATAFAHSRPIRFDPAPGAVLSTAPVQVHGWFTAELRRDPNWTFLQVTDAQGTRVDTGDTELSSDRHQLSVNLQPGLGEGAYTVTWRGFDDEDGAILGDCYVFFVGQEAADQAIADRSRLDGGGTCQRIDFDATDGTPVPGQTPAAGGGHGGSSGGSEASGSDDNNDSSGVPIWALVLGVVGGIVVGGIGGRLASGGRS